MVNMQDMNSSVNDLKKILDNITNFEITHSNYMKVTGEITMFHSIINVQTKMNITKISQLYSEEEKLLKKYKENGNVINTSLNWKNIYDLSAKQCDLYSETQELLTLQTNMGIVIYEKMITALDHVKGNEQTSYLVRKQTEFVEKQGEMYMNNIEASAEMHMNNLETTAETLQKSLESQAKTFEKIMIHMYMNPRPQSQIMQSKPKQESQPVHDSNIIMKPTIDDMSDTDTEISTLKPRLRKFETIDLKPITPLPKSNSEINDSLLEMGDLEKQQEEERKKVLPNTEIETIIDDLIKKEIQKNGKCLGIYSKITRRFRDKGMDGKTIYKQKQVFIKKTIDKYKIKDGALQ